MKLPILYNVYVNALYYFKNNYLSMVLRSLIKTAFEFSKALTLFWRYNEGAFRVFFNYINEYNYYCMLPLSCGHAIVNGTRSVDPQLYILVRREREFVRYSAENPPGKYSNTKLMDSNFTRKAIGFDLVCYMPPPQYPCRITRVN